MSKVSIITPINLDKSTLRTRCVESLSKQSSKDFEWVVVFDGKTVVPEFINPGGLNLRWAITGDNYGPSVARNVGFEISSGDIITYLDSDDELYSTRVSELIHTFNTYPIDLLFSSYKIKYPGFEVKYNHFDYVGEGKHFRSFDEYLKMLQRQNISIPLGVAHTRKIFKEAGGFQRGIVCGEDGILWRRMVDRLDNRRIMFEDVIAGIYYVNDAGQSRSQKRFSMGGFAFDGSKEDNGRYLDKDWFETYNSKNLFDKEPWNV